MNKDIARINSLVKSIILKTVSVVDLRLHSDVTGLELLKTLNKLYSLKRYLEIQFTYFDSSKYYQGSCFPNLNFPKVYSPLFFFFSCLTIKIVV